MERYLRDLERAPLAARTRDAYGQHVRAYGAWLAGRPEPGVAITEPRARDHAARDFKRHLKVERGWKPSSVNLALAAVDHFKALSLGSCPQPQSRLVSVASLHGPGISATRLRDRRATLRERARRTSAARPLLQ